MQQPLSSGRDETGCAEHVTHVVLLDLHSRSNWILAAHRDAMLKHRAVHWQRPSSVWQQQDSKPDPLSSKTFALTCCLMPHWRGRRPQCCCASEARHQRELELGYNWIPEATLSVRSGSGFNNPVILVLTQCVSHWSSVGQN